MTCRRASMLAPAAACLAIGLAASVSGCGVQAAGAYRADPKGPGRFGMLVDAHLLPSRGHGPTAGVQLGLSDPAPEPGFRLRNVKLAVGYRFPFHPLSVEVGGDSGLGAPMFARFQGTGVYVGGRLAALVRLAGAQDTEAGFAPGAPLVDLVLTGHGGLWSPPLGAAGDERGDVGVSVGVRLTGISDLFSPNLEGWER